jgi:hypothetical protein
MHVRITTVTGATKINEGIEHLRDEVVPQLQQQRGYRGLTASGDRAAGIVSVLTLWDTQGDLDASESMVEKVRNEAVAAFGGGTQNVERFEQTVAEVGPNPPTLGSKLQGHPKRPVVHKGRHLRRPRTSGHLTKGQPWTAASYFFCVQVQSGKWIAPNGSKQSCLAS